MPTAQLGHHHHGKGRVRIVKVRRTAQRHFVQQYEVEIWVEAPDAADSYYTGNNTNVLPTDSMKNTVYALAKKHEFQTMEEFGIILARHFTERHGKMMAKAEICLVETNWERIQTRDSKGQIRPHHHAFVEIGSAKRFTKVVATSAGGGRATVGVESGISGLKVLKTTQSAFEKFYKDEYTTLPEVPDRLVGTVVKATWKYKQLPRDFQAEAELVKETLLETFAGPADTGAPSPAVQYTLYKMGEAVLEKSSCIDEIRINMPNVHNLPVNQSHFGLKNIHPHGEIFLPVDEPHGMIEATVVRNIGSRL